MTRRRTRTSAAVTVAAVALTMTLLGHTNSSAQVPILDGNPWLERGVLNIAHRGGAHEAPENTLFAYRTALANGADMLELDIYQTADGELVAIHDATVDRTTDGSGAIADLTLAEIQALDAAYWFADGRGAVSDAAEEEYRFRGIATGEQPVPAALQAVGIGPEDFRIPTVREVLETFPGVWKVIELKPNPEAVGSFEVQTAELLREFGRSDDVIVASFIDVHLELFKAAAPEIHTSYPLGETAAHWLTTQGPLPGVPNRHVALQVPIEFEGAIQVVDEQFVADAHNLNVVVQVWTINDCPTMVDLLDLGVDGIMTDRSALLSAILAQPADGRDCDAAERSAAAAPGLFGVTSPGHPSTGDDQGTDTIGTTQPSAVEALPRTGAGGVPTTVLMVAVAAILLRLVLLTRAGQCRHPHGCPESSGARDRSSGVQR